LADRLVAFFLDPPRPPFAIVLSDWLVDRLLGMPRDG
jgi:hypothetical protein